MKRSRATFFRKRAQLSEIFLEALDFSSDENGDMNTSLKRSTFENRTKTVNSYEGEAASNGFHGELPPTLSPMSCGGNQNQIDLVDFSSDDSLLDEARQMEVVRLTNCSRSSHESSSGSGLSHSCSYTSNGTEEFYKDVSDSSESIYYGEKDAANDSDESDDGCTLVQSLRAWFIKFNITLAALAGLLLILRPFIPGLPKDPRTVVQSATLNTIEKMGDGEYFHFGLKSKVGEALAKVPCSSNVIELILHHDGIPLFKSSGTGYYPILCSLFHGMKQIPPFVVTIYCGKDKPPLQDFLKDFAPELHDLLQNGLLVGSRQYDVTVRCFICDAPAKAYIKGTIGHGGYYSCEFCEQEGFHKGRMTFQEMNANLRTDESFFLETQPKHHKVRSPLTDTGLNMVSCFPLDYLHLILLGVMRSLMFYWFDKANKKKKKLKLKFITLINNYLVGLGRMWPSDFSRKPRSTDDLKRWKGTEFRQLLLYIGPGIFKPYFTSGMFKIFMLLHVAITILCREDLHQEMNDVAHNFLRKCARKCREEFGIEILHYNFHNLIHLAPHSKTFGPLDSFSSFAFESYLGVLKRLTKSTKSPLKMLVKRLLCGEDINYIHGRSNGSRADGPVASTMHFDGFSALKGKFFKKYYWHGTVLSSKEGDNCVIMNNGTVVLIDNIVCTTVDELLEGRNFTVYEEAYKKPLLSSSLGIRLVSKLRGRPQCFLLRDVCWKAVLVPYKDKKDKFICSPMRK